MVYFVKESYPFYVKHINGNELRDKDGNKIATFREDESTNY